MPIQVSGHEVPRCGDGLNLDCTNPNINHTALHVRQVTGYKEAPIGSLWFVWGYEAVVTSAVVSVEHSNSSALLNKLI